MEENTRKMNSAKKNDAVMLSNCQGHVVFPKTDKPVGFFFPVAVDTQVDFCCQGIDILGDLAGGIIGFGIGQVIHELSKIACHFIRVFRRFLLQALPAILVFLDK